MKQILQSLSDGETILAEVPRPSARWDHLLIKTRCSVVSIGTERMLIDFGKSGWIEKARKQPEKVKQVLEKIRTDGVFATLDAVKGKLDQSIPLGYCNVGTVLERPSNAYGTFEAVIGDRVVSNGPHAEVVCVPRNLCAKIPDSVSDDEAAFTVMGAIGLQGVRLIQPTLGECVAVTGLGLIGLIVVQLLRAQGCRVLGIDFDSGKCALAREFGAEAVDLSKGEDPVAAGIAFSRGRGMDGVLITASTSSNEPVHQAALMCRKRGRIVLVGVAGLQLSRVDFYEKELSFQVSCSYGPGRYDENYEQNGQDYPVGFVRWTEQRNFEAVLDMMADRRIDVRPLISHRFSFADALKAYSLVAQGKGLGILLDYSDKPEMANSTEGAESSKITSSWFAQTVALGITPSIIGSSSSNSATVGLIGSGNFTGIVLLPALAKTGARLKTIASVGGVTGTHFGRKFGFEFSTTDTDSILKDSDINTVLITTRHNSHARYVIAALKAGKHVYVEKPLCLTMAELEEIVAAYRVSSESGVSGQPVLMVGFNRRFAPHVIRMKSLLDTVKEPKTLIMTVNAGTIPPKHWIQDPSVGGGRIIGEGCHFVDLLRHLVGHPIVGVQTAQIMVGDSGAIAEDKMTITLSFKDGSLGTVHYFANGHKSFSKERLEVFAAGRILQLDNFRKLIGYGWPGFKKANLWRQDKGHAAEMQAFIDSVREGKPSPIPFSDIVEVTKTCFNIMKMARE